MLVAQANAAFYFVNVTNTGSVDSDEGGGQSVGGEEIQRRHHLLPHLSRAVVLGFLVPPGNGTDGVPIQVCLAWVWAHPHHTVPLLHSALDPFLQELFGFERVHVPAGQTVTVYLGAQGVRFTQAGADGVRRALHGDYTVRFGVRATAALGGGFAEFRVRAE